MVLSAAKMVAGMSSSARQNRFRSFMSVSPNLLTLGNARGWPGRGLRGRLLEGEELIQVAIDLQVDVHDDVYRFLATTNRDIGAAGEKKHRADQKGFAKEHVISVEE